MGERCASRSYLILCSKERPWTGRPSTTQLIQGTMCAFLKLTNDYAISPDSRAFMLHGTKAHEILEDAGGSDEFSMLEHAFTDETQKETGILDFIEKESGINTLGDYKTSGSYKVAKALGIVTADQETDEVFKSGKRKGQKKTIKIMKRVPEAIDRWEWELQLNLYRIKSEKKFNIKIHQLKIQCCVRDGGTYIAFGRGVFRNIYYFKINILDDNFVVGYFDAKRQALELAMKQGWWDKPCNGKENWDGVKCARYCEVAEFCSYGKYLKQEKEADDMAIKNLSDIRRMPRLGKIRLGITKIKEVPGKGPVEYPAEVNYFILDPETPLETERTNLLKDFEKLFGKEPKQIRIMLPPGELDVVFPQFYKRYGKSTSLQCRGDGVQATCSKPEYAEGLKVTGKTDGGQLTVECLGRECPYYKDKSCTEVGTLNILVPELKGAGVWQITTGSFHSIVNLNSCMEYIRAMVGRFHMIPLLLERREQEVVEPGGKVRKHYIMHINLDFKLKALQQYAQIDASKILLELPEPNQDEQEIKQLTTIETAGQVVEDKGPGTGDFYGDVKRFGPNAARALGIINQIKICREKLGEKRFMYVLGGSGNSQVAEIISLEQLVNLYNALASEVKTKEETEG